MTRTPERWLVTGAAGQLGGHLVRRLATEGDAATVLALHRGGQPPQGATPAVHDLADQDSMRRFVAEFRPTHILHVGAMTAVADCHRDPDAARRINVAATLDLAQLAAECGAFLVFSSTDMVFSGDAAPYRETDQTGPLSVYGRTKVEAEELLAPLDHVAVVRLPLMYGKPVTAKATTFVQQIAAIRAGQPLKLFTDEHRTPVALADAAAALIGLARARRAGVIHVAGPERLSRLELIARAAALLGIPDAKLEPVSRLQFAAAELRPADLSLDGSLFARALPHLTPRPMCAAHLEGL